MAPSSPTQLSRRTLAAGAAWSVPAIVVASAAPSVAASCGGPVQITGTTTYPYDPNSTNNQDVTERTNSNPGYAEVNADGWSWETTAPTVTIRPWATTDNVHLTSVTLTWVATGFTWGSIVLDPVTGTSSELVDHGTGRTGTATGIGTPTMSADGTTVTLTIDDMPTYTAMAFKILATATVTNAASVLFIDSSMTATVAC